jgi:hypothetical protein
LRIELDDHVGAFVGDPNVVFAIDANGMREGPGIEVVADFSEKFSIGGEFEKLGGGGSVSGAGGIAAGEDENVAFGVDGDAYGFAKVQVRRKFQKIRNGAVADFWDGLLSEKREGEEGENCGEGESDGLPPSLRMCKRRGRLYTWARGEVKN